MPKPDRAVTRWMTLRCLFALATLAALAFVVGAWVWGLLAQ